MISRLNTIRPYARTLDPVEIRLLNDVSANDLTPVNTFTYQTNNTPVTNELNTDLAYVLHGVTGSRHLITNASGGPTEFRLSSSSGGFSIKASTAGWWVYVVDYTQISSLVFYAGTTNFASFDLQTYSFSDGHRKYNGWHFVGFNGMEMLPTTYIWEQLGDTKLRINPVGTNSVELYIDSAYAGHRAKAQIPLMFDDGLLSHSTIVAPILDAAGIHGSFGVYADAVDSGDALTLSQAEEMYANGHDIIAHGQTSLTTLGLAAATADVQEQKDWLIDKGFTRGLGFYVYPNGDYDTPIINMLQGKGYIAARTTTNPIYHHHDFGLTTQSFLLGNIGMLASDSTASIIALIDKAIAYGSTSPLMLHDIVSSGASGTSVNTADFQTVVDYLVLKISLGEVTCPSVSEWIYKMGNAPLVKRI